MIGVELPLSTADEALRVVRALGSHRYVLGRLHLVHAFVFASIDGDDALSEARAWAETVLGDASVDASSRDERLWRRASEAELRAALGAFWTPGERAASARARLRERLARAELEVPPHAAFDESVEEDIHPLLVDAGWELIPLAQLDREKHKGAIDAFGEPILFEAAAFEEETSIPPPVTLHELPGVGPIELLSAVDDDGKLRAPLVLWTEGNETYLDYVLRGVLRAAKLASPTVP